MSEYDYDDLEGLLGPIKTPTSDRDRALDAVRQVGAEGSYVLGGEGVAPAAARGGSGAAGAGADSKSEVRAYIDGIMRDQQRRQQEIRDRVIRKVIRSPTPIIDRENSVPMTNVGDFDLDVGPGGFPQGWRESDLDDKERAYLEAHRRR